jgi:protein-disulfide isomerase
MRHCWIKMMLQMIKMIKSHQSDKETAKQTGLVQSIGGCRIVRQVRSDERRAGEVDIHAVPTFVLDGRFAIPGAQDSDTFLRLLEQAAAKSGA